MKKGLLLLSLFIYLSVQGYSQILDPVHWTFASKHFDGNTFELTFTAKIDKGWHIFSQKLPDSATPLPTTFTFKDSSTYSRVGEVREVSTPQIMKDVDKTTDLKMYMNEAVFKQTIKVNGKAATVKGSLNYMKCDEKQCLPPEDVDFKFDLDQSDGGSAAPVNNNNASVMSAPGNKTDSAPPANNNNASVISASQNSTDIQGKSLWEIFGIGLLAGLGSLITPCVYSMIPLTVTFFTKRSGSRKKGITNSLVYSLSIMAIFVLLGFFLFLFHVSGDSLNEFASNGFFNFILFLLFIVFAISFFGVFEITLPSAWVNKTESMSDKGGFIGIFFMALTLVLISFSCTAPFIGSALAYITTGHALGPIVGMFAYSFALAFPFGLFAFFPNWLHSLPKSGGWLNVVKVSFAFVELALALKFLSNVDLVYHWHLLSRDIFLALWIIIFLLLGLYLLGLIRFVHDSEVNHVSVPRLFFAILALAFTLYMVPGLWGAPLKAISAFAPPLANQEFNLSNYAALRSTTSVAESGARKYGDIFHCPYGLNCYFDYNEGVAEAKKEKKPVFLDFTGWSCVNCRKMEASVWADPEVQKRMMNDYIVISMYVDDKTTLPGNEQYISKFSGKDITTLGNKNSDLEASRYNINSQPFYVLLDDNEQVLTQSRGYNEDVDDYVKFLDSGLGEFKKRMAN